MSNDGCIPGMRTNDELHETQQREKRTNGENRGEACTPSDDDVWLSGAFLRLLWECRRFSWRWQFFYYIGQHEIDSSPLYHTLRWLGAHLTYSVQHGEYVTPLSAYRAYKHRGPYPHISPTFNHRNNFIARHFCLAVWVGEYMGLWSWIRCIENLWWRHPDVPSEPFGPSSRGDPSSSTVSVEWKRLVQACSLTPLVPARLVHLSLSRMSRICSQQEVPYEFLETVSSWEWLNLSLAASRIEQSTVVVPCWYASVCSPQELHVTITDEPCVAAAWVQLRLGINSLSCPTNGSASIVLGLDTETDQNVQTMDKRVDVLQLATETGDVLVYRLNGPCAHFYQFPLALRYVLENPFILKVGCACDIDCAELITHFHLCSESVIDLQYCCDQLRMHSPGSRRRGLHEFVDAFMGKELMQISRGEGKRVAKSNWRSIAQLTQKQITYAAHDAFACSLIFVMAEQKSYGPLRQLPKWIFLCPPER